MAERFRACYPAAGSVVAVPNSVALPDDLSASSARAGGRPLTLGLLATLSFDKGLAQFIALVERARDQGLPVRGILAGPSFGSARHHLQEALSRLGPALEWRGPVAGAEKERFFADIDVFVFPTDYPAEAYPLVVLEALVRGLPVITKERGCIGDFASLAACFVHPREGDFVAAAIPQVAGFAAEPERLAQAASDARREGRALNEHNRRAGDSLIDAIVAAATESRD